MTNLPEAANDNEPKTQLAEQLTALLEYYNRPDTAPDPLQSSWSVEPSVAVVEVNVEEDGEIAETFAEDLLLEITPSIRQIVREIKDGPVVRGKPKVNKKGEALTKQGPII